MSEVLLYKSFKTLPCLCFTKIKYLAMHLVLYLTYNTRNNALTYTYWLDLYLDDYHMWLSQWKPTSFTQNSEFFVALSTVFKYCPIIFVWVNLEPLNLAQDVHQWLVNQASYSFSPVVDCMYIYEANSST